MVTVGEHYNSWEVLEIIDDKKCLARCECANLEFKWNNKKKGGM